MTNKRRLSYILPLGLAFAILDGGCHSSALEVNGPSGLAVQASLSAVSLADDCAAKAGDSSAGACLEGTPCPPLCQQSTMQIALQADDGSEAPVAFEIAAVRVLDHDSHALVSSPTARDPRQWTSTGYTSWDQHVAPRAQLKVSYDLSASMTTAFRGSGTAPTYLVEVDVIIDGVARTLSLDGVTREPPLAT